MENWERFFVVTGGPGSGKTSLLAALAARGIATTEEAGRAVIRDQVAIGGEALPWADKAAFAERMLAFDMRTYRRAAEREGPVVFDRGIPDTIGYRRLVGLPVPLPLDAAARRFRYARCVFIAPPWPYIFEQDAERKQTLAEAEATYHAMSAVYSELGYELVALPLVAIDARAMFVADTLARTSSETSCT